MDVGVCYLLLAKPEFADIYIYYLQNSNIVEFFTTLKKDDHDKQMVYYQVHSKIIPRSDIYLL